MDCLNHLERKALGAAANGIPYEHRSRLGGEKTFAKLLGRGWIELYADHNPRGDRYSITEAGREARNLPNCSSRQKGSRLKTMPRRLKEPKGPLDK